MTQVSISNGLAPIVNKDKYYAIVSGTSYDTIGVETLTGANCTLIDFSNYKMNGKSIPEIFVVEANAAEGQLVTDNITVYFLDIAGNIIDHVPYQTSLKNFKLACPADTCKIAINSFNGNLIVSVGSALHTVVQNEMLAYLKKQEVNE